MSTSNFTPASPAAVSAPARTTKPSLSQTLPQEGSRSPPFAASSPASASPPSQALPPPPADYPRSAMHAVPASSAPAKPSPTQAAILPARNFASSSPESFPSPPFLQSSRSPPPDPTTGIIPANSHPLVKRPTNADNAFKTSAPTISLSSSSEDMHGTTNRMPSTSNGAHHSKPNTLPRPKPAQYNSVLESPGPTVLSVSSGSSTSGATISSETLFTPPVEQLSYFPLGHAEPKSNAGDQEYYKTAKTVSNEKLAGWPKQASNIRWVTPDASHNLTVVTSNNPVLASPPASLSSPPLSSPDSVPTPSSGNAFKRFLSRGKNKDSDRERRPSTSHSEFSATAHSHTFDTTSIATSPIKEVSLSEIERQIAELEEEKKKIKKEAKLKALLSQSTNGVAVIGGMAV